MTDYTQAIRVLENEAEYLERRADMHRQSARFLRLRMERRHGVESQAAVATPSEQNTISVNDLAASHEANKARRAETYR